MKIVISVLMLLVCVALPAFAQDDAKNKKCSVEAVDALFGRLGIASKAMNKMKADINMIKTTDLTGAIKSVGTVEYLRSKRFRCETTEVDMADSTLWVVVNGSEATIAYPDDKMAEVYDLKGMKTKESSAASWMSRLTLNRVDLEKDFTLNVFREGDLFRIQLMPKTENVKARVQEMVIWTDGVCPVPTRIFRRKDAENSEDVSFSNVNLDSEIDALRFEIVFDDEWDVSRFNAAELSDASKDTQGKEEDVVKKEEQKVE